MKKIINKLYGIIPIVFVVLVLRAIYKCFKVIFTSQEVFTFITNTFILPAMFIVIFAILVAMIDLLYTGLRGERNEKENN